MFVDVEALISWRQDFRFVDAVNANGLQNLGLDKMADATFCHDWNSDRFFNANDQFGIAHASDTAMSADIGWHTLQCHHRRRACLFSDLCLIGGDDITDNPALEHLWKTAFDLYCSCLFLHV